MPIIHTIKWIVNLSKGRFEEPRNRKGRPRSRNKKGKRKQPYRLFTEVFELMEQLTETLKKDEQNRKKIQTTREEWIAGLSHDLKTPLSTIYGYSMMLESPNYGVVKRGNPRNRPGDERKVGLHVTANRRLELDVQAEKRRFAD